MHPFEKLLEKHTTYGVSDLVIKALLLEGWNKALDAVRQDRECTHHCKDIAMRTKYYEDTPSNEG